MITTELLRLAREANDLIVEYAPEHNALIPIIILLSLHSYNNMFPIEISPLFNEAV